MPRTGLMSTITNIVNRKKYFVSTVEGIAGWETAVFRKIIGPFANFKRPEFHLGGSEADRAADRHERVIAIVRDIKSHRMGAGASEADGASGSRVASVGRCKRCRLA